MKYMKNMNCSFYKGLSGFTLVELMVVITILAILGTIAFLSLQGYSASARDSERIQNLANLNKGLSVFQVKTGYYPQPEWSITLMTSGSVIGNQGFAKDRTVMFANLSPGGSQDPSDSSMYATYLVNTLGTKMQLTAFLEDGSKITAANLPLGVSEAYASSTTDYSKRTPFTKGDAIGVLLSTATGNLNQPLQENISATFTGIDLALFAGSLSNGTPVSLKALTSNTQSITGTGGQLMAIESNLSGKMRLVMYACPTVAGWTDLGSVPSGPAGMTCTANNVLFTPCKICEATNNAQIPENSIIATNSGSCIWPSFVDTWFTTQSWWSFCLPTGWSACHMCKSTSLVSIPTGTITLMQACPVSWSDLGSTPAWGTGTLCLYGKSCRICQKL